MKALGLSVFVSLVTLVAFAAQSGILAVGGPSSGATEV
jgi:hypothetical protein